MSERKVKQIVEAQQVRMGKDYIYQAFPSNQLRNVDPFILLHHWGPYSFPPGNDAFSVEAHPHRGFEPVTFIFQGEVHHRDTMGNDSIIKTGGVQWMTAGKGVMHSEMGTEDFHKTGGMFEIIQVWMNLPKKLKMNEPSYQGFQKESIPVIIQDSSKTKIAVVSGSIENVNGTVKSLTGITSATIYIEEGGKASIETKEKDNIMLYLLDGSVNVNGRVIEEGRKAITFNESGSAINIEALKSSKLLFLAGAPLNEPVAQYGPFVMNTVDELQAAFEDFNNGKMGIL